MNIRTITIGCNLTPSFTKKTYEQCASFTGSAKDHFRDHDYHVQTVRLATQPWSRYFSSEQQFFSLIDNLEEWTKSLEIDYVSIGPTSEPHSLSLVPRILQRAPHCFCTVSLCTKNQINYEIVRQAASLFKQISRLDKQGFTNLRFAALCNPRPNTPFFPTAFHKGPSPAFGIGTENSDLLSQAFQEAKTLLAASQQLHDLFSEHLISLEQVAQLFSKNKHIRYHGIDPSVCPSCEPKHSIASAIEHIGLGSFGGAGTLAIAKMITETLQTIEIKQCGYSGLMLPVLEDYGLAQKNREGKYTVQDLLLYSSVCGTGLDTIPLPGDVPEETLYALLLDLASLSLKLQKPLSARLMPIPGKKAGEMTTFDFEYFVNSTIMNI
jgi:uncharacterized protein (UPF0210 family)